MGKNAVSKIPRKRVIVLPTIEENRRIVKAAKADPDAQPLTSAQLKSMVPLKRRAKARN